MNFKKVKEEIDKIEAVCIERKLKPTARQIISVLFDRLGMTENITMGVMFHSHDINALAAKLAEVK
tara:strand:+ start:296 stop:493 length:198 start_codon:yes stop_codon:yes gene_type:complete